MTLQRASLLEVLPTVLLLSGPLILSPARLNSFVLLQLSSSVQGIKHTDVTRTRAQNSQLYHPDDGSRRSGDRFPSPYCLLQQAACDPNRAAAASGGCDLLYMHAKLVLLSLWRVDDQAVGGVCLRVCPGGKFTERSKGGLGRGLHIAEEQGREFS